jgi:hypothetical protein
MSRMSRSAGALKLPTDKVVVAGAVNRAEARASGIPVQNLHAERMIGA